MFVLRDFVMKTLRTMVRIYPEAQVRQFALSYYGHNWITEADLAEVETWFVVTEEPTEDEPVADGE